MLMKYLHIKFYITSSNEYLPPFKLKDK
jgi:hypothetical protein